MARGSLDIIPGELVEHVTAMCGERGAAWFAALPELIAELEAQWKITVGRPFAGIEFNFVAEATDDTGSSVVVKIAPPFKMVEIFAEAKYLRLRDGEGAVRLLAEDRDRKAILLERAIPGDALHERFASDPIGCIDPAIRLLKRVLDAPPADTTEVPRLDEWFARFRARKEAGFPSDLAEWALTIYERLSSRPGQTFYIHGDYHPGNIVAAVDGFQVIDPKGIVGGLGYDIAVFLINLERWQRTNPGIHTILDEAVTRFAAAFGLTAVEVREWVFVHMVIGAWWNFDDMPELYDPELAMPEIWHL